MNYPPSVVRLARRLVLVISLAAASGCGAATRTLVPPGTSEPDRFLFERGTTALNDKKWLSAREFFKQLTETYTQSPFRPDAKLGIGDTYLGEDSPEALVLAINEFKEFLTFYPTNARADYAQYKLGIAHARQMRAPQRDQAETRATVKELETFVERYPNSPLMSEAKTRLREAKDRLSQSDYEVGLFYFRTKWYPGAIDRFKAILNLDPAFTSRDGVYFHLAEALIKMNRTSEALPYYEKLVAEFEKSAFLEDTNRRLATLKPQTQSSQAGG